MPDTTAPASAGGAGPTTPLPDLPDAQVVPTSLARSCSVDRIADLLAAHARPDALSDLADRALVATLRALPQHDPYLEAALLDDHGDLLGIALSQSLVARLTTGRRPLARQRLPETVVSQRAWVRYLTRKQGDDIAEHMSDLADRVAGEQTAVLVEVDTGSSLTPTHLADARLDAIADEARRRGFALLVHRGVDQVHPAAGTVSHFHRVVRVPTRLGGLLALHTGVVLGWRRIVAGARHAWRWLAALTGVTLRASQSLPACVRRRTLAPLRTALAGWRDRAANLDRSAGAEHDSHRLLTPFGLAVSLLTPDDVDWCRAEAPALARLLVVTAPEVGVSFAASADDLAARLRLYLTSGSDQASTAPPPNADEPPADSRRWLIGRCELGDRVVGLVIGRLALGTVAGKPVRAIAIRGAWLAPELSWHECGRALGLYADLARAATGATEVRMPVGSGLRRLGQAALGYGHRPTGRLGWTLRLLGGNIELLPVLRRELSPHIP